MEKVLASAPDLIALDEKKLEQEAGLPVIASIDEKTSDPPSADGKLAVDEEKVEGKVSFSIMRSLVSSFGGPAFWLSFFFLHIAFHLGSVLRSWWFSVWSRSYSENAAKEVNIAW